MIPNHVARSFRTIRGFSFFIMLLMSPGLLWAVDPAPFTGVELTIPDETVPPGGMVQLKMQITEPKPISKGGQKSRFQAQFLGPVKGIALFSPAGDASGTAVLSKGAAQFSLNSPLFTMGDIVDYPIVTIAIPVKPTAIPGKTAALALDPSLSQWIDPSGQNYPVLLKDGILTVGGTLSITNVVPGGGVVPVGVKIAILGVGFTPDTKVQVNDAIIDTQTFVSSTEIDVTLTADANMTSRRIRVIDPATNERVTYYSYQRMTAMGKSKHPLVAATVPLFSQSNWTVAYFKAVKNASQFSGLALENPTAQVVKVRLELHDSSGTLLKAKNVQLMPGKRFTRDLAEMFIGIPVTTGMAVKATSPVAIPMLGLLGDDVLGTVDPVDPLPNL